MSLTIVEARQNFVNAEIALKTARNANDKRGERLALQNLAVWTKVIELFNSDQIAPGRPLIDGAKTITKGVINTVIEKTSASSVTSLIIFAIVGLVAVNAVRVVITKKI